MTHVTADNPHPLTTRWIAAAIVEERKDSILFDVAMDTGQTKRVSLPKREIDIFRGQDGGLQVALPGRLMNDRDLWDAVMPLVNIKTELFRAGRWMVEESA